MGPTTAAALTTRAEFISFVVRNSRASPPTDLVEESRDD